MATAMKVGGRELREVDAATLRAWLDTGEAMVIDVREPAEFQAAHLPGATLLPLSRFDPRQVTAIDGVKVVVHCKSGTRASQACEQLLECGCDNLYLFRPGIEGWREAGFEVEGHGREPLSLQRQVQLCVGTFILAGMVLGLLVSPWFLALPAFCGVGMLVAGATGRCGLAMLLARLPYNQGGGAVKSCSV